MSLVNTSIKPFKAQAYHNRKFVEVTEVNPVNEVTAPPKLTSVVPIVTLLFVNLALLIPPNNIPVSLQCLLWPTILFPIGHH